MGSAYFWKHCHFGDPCFHCGVPMLDVEEGPCPANDGKLKVSGYASLGVRPDGVEHFRYQTTDGIVHEVHRHVSERAAYYHFGLSDELRQPPPHDLRLRRMEGSA